MKTLTWIGIGGAAVIGLGLLLARKRTGVAPSVSPAPEPTKTYGETTKVSLAVPSGWRRATSAEVSALPELRTQASALMSSPGFTALPYGTLNPFVASDGRTYATWVEQHYHEPGGSVQPWGFHHGVTVLAKADSMLSDDWSVTG